MRFYARVCVCLHVCLCELVAGIKDVMQDYPAGRLPTSTAEEEMARRRGWRAADGEMEGATLREEFINQTRTHGRIRLKSKVC